MRIALVLLFTVSLCHAQFVTKYFDILLSSTYAENEETIDGDLSSYKIHTKISKSANPSEDPTVIFIHGTGSHMNLYWNFIEGIAVKRRCFAWMPDGHSQDTYQGLS